LGKSSLARCMMALAGLDDRYQSDKGYMGGFKYPWSGIANSRGGAAVYVYLGLVDLHTGPTTCNHGPSLEYIVHLFMR
jgi:hypothetical protein